MCESKSALATSSPKSMLVHICCSVDSHYFLQELQKLYPDTRLMGFFYNPNIHPYEEYLLRLQDVKRSCARLGISLIEGDYTLQDWLEAIKGLEEEREKGARCNVCFDVRLETSAQMALMLGVNHFSTTLLSSPMKEQEVLRKQGGAIGEKYGLEFVYLNVRAQGGVEKQNALAKRDKLYRQNYCGCKFALNAQREVQNKPCMELINSLDKQIHPASIAQRLELFAQRDKLELQEQNYHLLQQSLQTYLLLRGVVRMGNKTLKSLILKRSMSKKIAIKDLEVHTITLKPTLAEEILGARYSIPIEDIRIALGLSVKDETLFLDTEGVARLLDAPLKPLEQLTLSYAQELYIREKLVGAESIQPIVIIQDLDLLKNAHSPITLEIVAEFFTHKNFYLLN
ncbi:epoxyqueuosine reductase QueH [Helicobacter felis]|uniref:epoxyqueuosine reductase QueH n=1 Tax=Helicobacter felis TaxID=214 RepID=UPI000CEEC758|nr:epoxyqueuosine reductase QueH [Helicobacter felis]